ncbi:PQQ-dependent sugar dehydrogenase [Phytoactinopolyspora mesophila]
MKSSRSLVAMAAVVLLVAACNGDGNDDGNEDPPSPEPTNDTAEPDETNGHTPVTPSPPATPVSGPVEPTDVDEIVTGLDAPWSIAFLSDGEALVSQRDDATIVHVTDTGEVTEVGEVPDVEGAEEGGLLGIAFDPESPDTLYVYATMGDENTVSRTTYNGDGFGEFETVFDGIPAHPYHNGGRIAFGPDGMLYVSTGDAGNEPSSQDPDSPAGAILRITPDGEIPDDNPIDDSPVYAYGLRNVQGLAFDDDERLWSSEFGPATVDELNLIEAGGNYGWPEVEGIAGDERFIDPEHEWPVEEASPSGLAYHADTLFMASLRGERLWQIPIPDGEAGEPQAFLDDYGRLRDVVGAPDGTLWVLTNNTDGRGDPREGDDRILRVTLG